jgi:mannose-6-phosphate isomerase
MPGSIIHAGLKPGVDRRTLSEALRQNRCQECLHSFQPRLGDCIYLPAGTVHALGAGLLVVEIQQSSDVTYRLFDWNRLGQDGKPRPLQVEQALEAVDFERGPVAPVRGGSVKGDSPPFVDTKIGTVPTQRSQVTRLVEGDRFVWDRWEFDLPLSVGGDQRCHILAVLEGAVSIEGDPSGLPLPLGGTALLPARLGPVRLSPQGKTVLLDAFLP